MLGYMSAKEAKGNGFTHHGSYYGIPCWIAPESGFMVATKWAPMEFVMSIAHVIEQFLFPIIRGPDAEPAFMFKLGGEIAP